MIATRLLFSSKAVATGRTTAAAAAAATRFFNSPSAGRKLFTTTTTSSSSSASTAKSSSRGPTVVAMALAGGLLVLPYLAIEEFEFHPDSPRAEKLQRFKTETTPSNPWSVEYPKDSEKDLEHGHTLHRQMTEGPPGWHKGLQRWSTKDRK